VLDGWQIFFDGVAAPLMLAAPGQITAIVPNEVAGKAHTVIGVQQQGVLTPAVGVTIPVNATAPRSSRKIHWGIGQAAAVNLDGTVNSIGLAILAGAHYRSGTPDWSRCRSVEKRHPESAIYDQRAYDGDL
jgi:uncharacterized protein (TIGR03437 family)